MCPYLSSLLIPAQRAQAALPELQKLNPRVALSAVSVDLNSIDQISVLPFNIVIAADLDLSTLSAINAACRVANKPFYAAGTHGLYGFIFSDLIMHDFVIEREQSNRPTKLGPETATRSVIASSVKKQDGKTIEMVTKREIYSPIILANTSPLTPDHTSSRRRKLQVPPLLACLRGLWEFQTMNNCLPGASKEDLMLFTALATEKQRLLLLPTEPFTSDFLRSFLWNLGSEIVPVTAFLGGTLAQDVINVIGQREQPIQNFLIFDGEESKGPVYSLHPVFEGDGALDPTVAAPGAMPVFPAMATAAVANGTGMV